MSDELAGRLRALAEEYTVLVDAMRSGQYDGAEYQRLSADRTLVHDELLQHTGMTRRDDMYAFCRDVLANRVPDG
jgi:hypothetical protein